MDGGGRKLPSLSGLFTRWTGGADAAGTIASADNVNPLTLAFRSRIRALGRRLGAIPAPRTGPGTSLAWLSLSLVGFMVPLWLAQRLLWCPGSEPALVSRPKILC